MWSAIYRFIICSLMGVCPCKFRNGFIQRVRKGFAFYGPRPVGETDRRLTSIQSHSSHSLCLENWKSNRRSPAAHHSHTNMYIDSDGKPPSTNKFVSYLFSNYQHCVLLFIPSLSYLL